MLGYLDPTNIPEVGMHHERYFCCICIPPTAGIFLSRATAIPAKTLPASPPRPPSRHTGTLVILLCEENRIENVTYGISTHIRWLSYTMRRRRPNIKATHIIVARVSDLTNTGSGYLTHGWVGLVAPHGRGVGSDFVPRLLTHQAGI